MDIGRRRLDVRPAGDELRGEGERNFERQRQAPKLEGFADLIARITSGQSGEQIALPRQRLFEWRQNLLGLQQGGFLGGDIDARHRPIRQLPL